MQNNPFEETDRDISAEISAQPVSLPLPGSEAYGDLPQFTKHGVLPFRRTIRRRELRQIVPLAETTIYEMERRGEFPQRFRLTARCVVWDLEEVQAWIEMRKQASRSNPNGRTPGPDVRQRKIRPVQITSDTSLRSMLNCSTSN